ncbi:MAG: PAS domain S-box protein [Cryomorphaceae bacterium]|nr:PAS domain S-box protein [Cryomorphaceae bacterium]
MQTKDTSKSPVDVREKISRVERLRSELAAAEAELSGVFHPHSFTESDILSNVREMIYVLDSRGFVIYVNRYFLEFSGFAENEVLGKYFVDFLGEEQKVEIEKFYFKQIGLQTPISYREFLIKTKNGEMHWIGQNVRMDFDSGVLKFVYVSARDITIERQLRDLLKASEEKYRGIIEHMKLGLMEVDLAGNILWMNRSFTILTGYDLDAVKGQNAKQLMVPGPFSEEMNRQEQLRFSGEAGMYETKLLRKSGEIRDVIISGAPIFDAQGKVVGSIGIHFDVTETRKTERDLKEARLRAEKAQQAEKEFLASMSHEIRTPLNAIIGMSHLLTESELSKEQAELMTSIYYSANLLRGLISDVLDFSKIEAGQLDVRQDSIDLNRLISSCIQMIGHGLEKENVRLEFEAEKAMPDRLQTDALLINQIVTNLLSNAIRFTDKGSVRVVLNAEQFGERWIIEISVTDTGLGISEDKIDLVFEKFKQIGERQGGTGLGLTITKRIVESLGGTIAVSSVLGVGSTFTVKIPMESAETVSRDLGIGMGVHSADCLVLVVDDNEMNIQYLTRVLEKLKIRYNCARDGVEAVEMTMTQHYNMIFMDVQMPRLNGLDATMRIRSDFNNPNCETPIVGLSAYAFNEDVQLSARAGMDNYLTKPFAPGDVQRMISKYFTESFLSDNSFKKVGLFNSGLDSEMLEDLYEGDVNYALDMFEIYLSQFGEYLNDLQTCISMKEVSGICANLHKIRSPLRMVGLSNLALLSEEIEKELHDSELSEKCLNELNKLIAGIVESDYMIIDSISKMKKNLNSEI